MKIVFCGGGTAGHVTPNLALVDQLAPHHQAYYVGTNGMEKSLVMPYVNSGKMEKFCQISAHKLQRKLTLDNFLLPFRLAKSVRQAKQTLECIEPNVVFSKGGYVGLPVIVACKKLGIPCVIHESDQTVGLSNRISALFATRFLSAFACHKKAQVVGMIVKKPNGNRQKGLQIMGVDGKKPVLLVMGGSLGASALNNAISQNGQLQKDFDVFVITGKGKKIECNVRQMEYTNQIAHLFAACDVCLTRGGSTSLAELTLANVPFVTVPLTKQSRGEQVKNAQYFCQKGCGILLSEENLTNGLTNAITAAFQNRAAIATKQRLLAPTLDGTAKTLEILLQMGKTKANAKEIYSSELD